MENPQDSPAKLAYATPAVPTGSGLAAGVWITLAGLSLIFLGGCFCIGIMIALNIGNINSTNASASGGASNTVFITLLYILAFACFAAAVFVMGLGIRKLLAIGRL